MDICDYSPAADARRFQSGTPPIPSIYAGIAGIELMQEIGIAETRAHVNDLNHRLIEGIDELRARLVTPRKPRRRGALVCVASTNVTELVAALRREGIVTSERDGNLRISAHAYNSVEDVDAAARRARGATGACSRRRSRRGSGGAPAAAAVASARASPSTSPRRSPGDTAARRR